MEILKEFENSLFFVLVAFVLAFSLYQSISVGLNTDTPIVTVISESMSQNYGGRFGRISESFDNGFSIKTFFSPQIGFNRGDIVLVRGVDFDEITAGYDDGDIIIFESDNEVLRDNMPPMIHRVVERDETFLTTKGDANEERVEYCVDRYGRFDLNYDSCSEDEKLVKIEENITEEQVLGKAFFVVPKVGYAKIIPSCGFHRVFSPNSDYTQYVCDTLF